MLVQLDSCIYKNAIRSRSITFAKLRSIKSLWGSAPPKPLHQWVSGMLPNHFGTSRKSLTFTQIYIWKKKQENKNKQWHLRSIQDAYISFIKKEKDFCLSTRGHRKEEDLTRQEHTPRVWEHARADKPSIHRGSPASASLCWDQRHMPPPPGPGHVLNIMFS